MENYLNTKSIDLSDDSYVKNNLTMNKEDNNNTELNPIDFLSANDKSALNLGKLVFSTLSNFADLSKKTGEHNFFLGKLKLSMILIIIIIIIRKLVREIW